MIMSSKAITAESPSKRFGSLKALTDADLAVESNELCAVIGPGGCGKSTLLRCIAVKGFENGTVRLRGGSTENYPVEAGTSATPSRNTRKSSTHIRP